MKTKMTMLAGALCASAFAMAGAEPYPATPRLPVQDTYHGTTITDDYRWLEDFGKPEVKAWVAAQNKLSRAALDAVPGRAAVEERVRGLLNSRSSMYYGLQRAGGKWFAIKQQPPKQQSLLVMLDSPDALASEKVVLDPNERAADGSLAIDFYVPSPDGKRVAVSLSEKGSEDGSIHLIEAASGQQVDVVIPRVQYPTGGGSVAWSADGKSLFYTRYPAPGERAASELHFHQQVWQHRLGQPLKADRYVIGKEFPRIGATVLSVARSGEQLAMVANGDGGEHAFYLHGKQGGWQRLAAYEDNIKKAEFGNDGWLYLLSNKDAPRGKILRIPLAKPQLKNAQLLVPETEGVLQHMEINGGKLFVSALLGGPSKLSVVDLKTLAMKDIALPPVSSVSGLQGGADGEVLALLQSYTEPPAWWRLQSEGQPVKTALASRSPVDFSDVEVKREFATSKDGTQVPLNIIHRKGLKLDGSNPTILNGYGGYNISQTPGFSITRKLWLERGGVYVIANLRGGGEYGEAWHLAGNLTKKQNVFDDFIAAAEHVIARGYSSPAKLAIQGGSNGGLLMGAALTQRPELFRAVHASVGIYDMMRIELDPNGAFNVTEFGTVKDKAQFEALYAYSPFHRVKDGTAYPAVLFTTGDHDGRVNPAQSRKMTARLQAANPAGQPILLRTSSASGHGMGSSLDETIKLQTDTFSFLLQQLGMAQP
ncbi:S9 family peptidase [Pelomonas sp. V22]|uniref:prolyl oligopeptidase family serine peptidase n=1 Tax=Pelomonas sp. V22 TaxID=2822139 RepID=UPI0024A8B3BF|nr:prolyl oligopeptidase family serine peptidase [Pelomonas sp. V22]MDI4634838.1 S9 family peptidase [Pelomonas sp. V22]